MEKDSLKCVVILPDGVADEPVGELGNRTPLDVAQHPNMDRIARDGITGFVRTIPRGMPPGSDVGCMSVFGYDPRRYYTGRAPLEAAACGINLNPWEVAFRCNTVTVLDGKMVDYSAGHIDSKDSAQLIAAVNERLGKHGIRFHAGVGYRHLVIVDSRKWVLEPAELAAVRTTPPHDITGDDAEPHLPRGRGADKLRDIMHGSVELLMEHEINARRRREGKNPATMLWLWGQGRATSLPAFQELYGRRAACISAVDIVRGIGHLAGFELLHVAGATGYFDTNYLGKAQCVLKALQSNDLVLVHIEATDEAGHMGDAKLKVKAIEDTDRLLVGPLLEGLRESYQRVAVLLVADHPTSTARRTHIASPVPFAMYASEGPRDATEVYTEAAVREGHGGFEEGFRLMQFLLNEGRK